MSVIEVLFEHIRTSNQCQRHLTINNTIKSKKSIQQGLQLYHMVRIKNIQLKIETIASGKGQFYFLSSSKFLITTILVFMQMPFYLSLDCSEVANANSWLSTSPAEQQNSCLCNPLYEWNSGNQQCEPTTCHDYSYNTKGFSHDRTECLCIDQDFVWDPIIVGCTCKPGYSWHELIESCTKNCSKVLHANISATDKKGNCVCGTRLSLVSEFVCAANCNQTINALSADPDDPGRCRCEQGFFWNYQKNWCQYDCSRIDNFAGNSEELSNSCVCKKNYYWDSNLYRCIIDCTALQNVDLLLSSHAKCVCNKGYKLVNGECHQDCNTVENPDSAGQLQCRCKEGYSWDSQLSVCVLNCSLIDNTVQSDSDSNTTCTCKNRYIWKPKLLACVKNCRQVENVNISASTQTQCSCRKKYYLSSDFVCSLNCSSIPYAITDLSNPQTCQCASKFVWNATSLVCKLNCSLDTRSTGFSLGQSACSCKSASYVWSFSIMSCMIDCSRIPNTAGRISIDVCACAYKYIWSPYQQLCNLNCQFIPRTNQKPAKDGKCTCLKGYKWDTLANTCH